MTVDLDVYLPTLMLDDVVYLAGACRRFQSLRPLWQCLSGELERREEESGDTPIEAGSATFDLPDRAGPLGELASDAFIAALVAADERRDQSVKLLRQIAQMAILRMKQVASHEIPA